VKDERLTSIAVSRARPRSDKAGRTVRTERPDRLCRGLYLVVQPSGSKSWALRYRHGEQSRKLTLGLVLGADEEAPGEPKIGDPLSLAAARRLAAEAMHQVELGRDPAREKADGRSRLALKPVETFQAVAENYLRREGKSLRSAGDRRADLERLVYPTLGRIPIAAIRRGDIIRLLDSIEDDRGPVMADKALALVRRIMSWHAARTDDFASPIIRGMARTKPRERARERVLADGELRSVWSAAESAGRFGAFVRFVLLTAARRNEAAELPWGELSGGDWVLPAQRNKVKQELVRPLSGAAQDVLDGIPRSGRFVFGAGDRPMGGFSKFKAAFDRSCGATGCTLHDLRRTARSLMSRAGVRPDVGELCLGHVVGGVRGTYDRHEYHEEKRQAFEALARQLRLILQAHENVIQLRPGSNG
jgi:integrase